jgi:hypothetical protein
VAIYKNSVQIESTGPLNISAILDPHNVTVTLSCQVHDCMSCLGSRIAFKFGSGRREILMP